MSAQATAPAPPETLGKEQPGHIVDTQLLKQKVHEARTRAEGLVTRGKDKVQVWEDDVEGYVRDRPLKALAIAAGIGAGLGLLLGVALMRR